MIALLLFTQALAAPAEDPPAPPASDDPSMREYDWDLVHSKAVHTSRVAQVFGAAGATAVGTALVFTYYDFDLGGAGEPNPQATAWMIGLGAGGLTISSAVMAGSGLRARTALGHLGRQKSAGAGYAAWTFTAATGAAWIATAIVVTQSDEFPGPTLPVLSAVTGVGGWVAGTVQLAIDEQGENELRGTTPSDFKGLRVLPVPNGLIVVF